MQDRRQDQRQDRWQDRRGGNRVALFYLFTALFWGTLYAYMSFFTNYAQKMGASASFAGLIVGGYGFVQMLLRVPLGVLSDRTRRRKPFVILGIAAALTAAAGMLVFPTPAGLFFFRAFAGVAAAAWVTITVLFSSYFSPEDAPRAMGRLNAVNMVGNMTASVVGAQLAGALGEPSAMWLAVALGAAGLVVSFFLRENRPADQNPVSVGELLKVGTSPTLLAVSLLALLFNMLYLGTSGSFLQPWAAGIGVTTGQLGFITVSYSAPLIIASLLVGSSFAKRFSPRAVVVAGAGMVAAALLLVPLTRGFYSLMAVQVLQGFGAGLCSPMLMSLAIISIAPEKRGVAMGFYQSIYALGMFIGPVLSGGISERLGIVYCFVIMGVLALVMCAGAGYLLKRKE